MKSPIVGGRIGWMVAAAGLSMGVLCTSSAMAQDERASELMAAAADNGEGVASHRSTIAKMFRRISIEFNENKLEDVVKFLEDYTGATLEVAWSDGSDEGLSREQPITLKAKNLPALTVLERVLAKATTDSLSGGATWQMTTYGTMEIGPKSVLNRTKRTELYDIHDLLIEIPRFDEVPQIDLQSLLQQSQQGGGGGGQSPFTNDQDREQEREGPTLQEKGDEVIKLITLLVEPEEWVEGGGEGGTIRYYNGTILVNAPDYMHRQINGYTYWPSHTSKRVGDRRYVSLSTDNSIGTVDGFTEVPVTAIVGGQPVSSDPGGSKAPAGKTPGKANPGGKTTPIPLTPKPAATPSKPATKQPAAKQPAKSPVGKQPAKKDEKR